MTKKFILLAITASVLCVGCVGCIHHSRIIDGGVLMGKVICIDPGHGSTADTDHFRVGAAGEREEWINLRVALILRDMLRKQGARVIMTRTKDVPVALKARGELARKNKADAFVSIHHNATADTGVNFPVVYFHGNASENQAGLRLGKLLERNFRDILFNGRAPLTVVSDYVIFPGKGAAVLRYSYGIPGVIGESSFFSNPDEEIRLRNHEYNKKEAEAYFKALKEFFSEKIPPIKNEYSLVKVPPYPVLQEAERDDKAALSWYEDYKRGKELLKEGDPALYKEALKRLNHSIRVFPDSPVAHRCHRMRAIILKNQGKLESAATARMRLREFYPQ